MRFQVIDLDSDEEDDVRPSSPTLMTDLQPNKDHTLTRQVFLDDNQDRNDVKETDNLDPSMAASAGAREASLTSEDDNQHVGENLGYVGKETEDPFLPTCDSIAPRSVSSDCEDNNQQDEKDPGTDGKHTEDPVPQLVDSTSVNREQSTTTNGTDSAAIHTIPVMNMAAIDRIADCESMEAFAMQYAMGAAAFKSVMQQHGLDVSDDKVCELTWQELHARRKLVLQEEQERRRMLMDALRRAQDYERSERRHREKMETEKQVKGWLQQLQAARDESFAKLVNGLFWTLVAGVVAGCLLRLQRHILRGVWGTFVDAHMHVTGQSLFRPRKGRGNVDTRQSKPCRRLRIHRSICRLYSGQPDFLAPLHSLARFNAEHNKRQYLSEPSLLVQHYQVGPQLSL